MDNIVVAIDFSDITPLLVEASSGLARCYGSRVYLIHVAAPDPEFVGLHAGPEHERQARALDLHNEKEELEKLAMQLGKAGINAIPLLIQGATAECLLSEVQRLDAQLLVMGTHGHGYVVSALLGSTSQSVLRKSRVPVMLVPFEALG